MLQKLRSCLTQCLTLAAVCAIIMPVLSAPAHAHSISDDVVFSKSATGNGTILFKTTSETPSRDHATSDHCCFAHHCCTILIPMNSTTDLPALPEGTIALNFHRHQIVSGRHIHGLDRPPKHLV